MSIVLLKAYTVKCDECGREYEGDEFSMWGDGDAAADDASESGWVCYHQDRPDKHYCPNCAEEDEDGNLLFIKP
jgi:hypothetical protein